MKKLLFSAAAIVILATTSCKKDPVVPTPQNPVVTPPIADLFASNLENAKQSFTINASQTSTITGANGTNITIYANSLRTATGASVSGNVNIELVEALEIGDMIWFNTQTLGNNNGTMMPLVSGGQLWINATQSGQQLQLAPWGSNVQVPTTSFDPSMELFFGSTDSSGNVVWTPADSSAIGFGQDSSGTYYDFPNDSVGWINCDYFYNTGGAQTVVDVTVPSGYDASNTMVWIVFPSINSVTGVYSYSSGVFSTNYYTLPVGMNVTIVALRQDGSNFYSAFATTTITNLHNEVLTFSSTTLSQFQQDVNGL
jgi:hypothetical protein